MAPKNAKLAKHSSKEFSFPRGGGAEVSQSFMEIDNGLDADDKGRKRKKDSKRKSQKLPRIQNGMQVSGEACACALQFLQEFGIYKFRCPSSEHFRTPKEAN